MSLAENVSNIMQSAHQCKMLADGGVAINTHCLYPSNGMVQVIVRSAGDVFFVSDDGGAIREALSAGAAFTKSMDNKLSAIATNQGLIFNNGIISAPRLPIESIAAAVILVANASKEMADRIFSAHRVR